MVAEAKGCEVVMIVPLTEDLAPKWDAFVADHRGGWVWHLSSWIAYLKASGRTDQSYAIVTDGEIEAICPVLLPCTADDPLPTPLGMSWDAVSWPVRGQPIRQQPANGGFQTRVIDLSLDEAALWANLRRSSHSPIRRAEEAYTVRVAPTVDGLALLYRQRPDLPQIGEAQWACLDRLQRAGLMRVWEALDGIGDVAGAAGIYVWKGWAYYGHGRTLGGKGVAHAIQWRVIRDLKAEGVPFYETGWCARDGDDEKARQIAHYKAGFGGAQWWVETR